MTVTGLASMPARSKSVVTGVASSGADRSAAAPKPVGCSVVDDPSRVERDDAVRRRQAALEPVFAEQHGHPPLLVEPSQQRDQLVAGDRVEL